MLSFRKPQEMMPEVERRVKRDLAEAVVHYRKNFDALREGTELIAGLCDRLGIDHGLDGIIGQLREPVTAPEQLPEAGRVETPDLGSTRDLSKAVSYTDEHGVTRWLKPGEFLTNAGREPPPKTEPTPQELRLALEASGCRYTADSMERMRLGHEPKWKDLPTSQRFRRKFHDAWRQHALPGSPDDALAALGYRGFLGPLGEADDEPFPNPYKPETPYQAPAAAENSGHVEA